MSNEPDVIRINGLKITNGTSASANSEPKTPFLIGVAGGTASGKVNQQSTLINSQQFKHFFASNKKKNKNNHFANAHAFLSKCGFLIFFSSR